MIVEDLHPRTRPGQLPAYSAPRDTRAWTWGAAVAALVFSTVSLTQSRVLLSDSYLGLYAGRFIDQHGLPHVDTLTLAGHGRPWIDQQWLAHLVSYSVWRAGGYPAVGLLTAFTIACAFLILTACLIRRGATPMRALTWAIVAFFVCQTNTIIRAQSLVYPLFALLLFLLMDDRARARPSWRLAAIPVVIAVYANLHGSVLLALGMVGVACLIRIGERSRQRSWRPATAYLLLGVVSAACAFCSPYGPGQLISYYGSVLGNPVIARSIPEWWPASFGGVSTEFVIVLALLIGILGFATGRGFRPDPFLLVVTVGFALAGITAVRYQVWFAFPSAILICDALNTTVGRAVESRDTAPRSPAGPSRMPSILGALALTLLALSAALAFGGASTVRMQVWVGFAGVIAGCDALHRLSTTGGTRWLRRGYPAALALVAVTALVSLAGASTAEYEHLTPIKAVTSAATYAGRHPDARLLTDDVSGPALLWLHPELQGRVAFDARLEIFSQHALAGYTDFVAATGDGWDRIVPSYDVIVVSRTLNPVLARKAAGIDGWRPIESDHEGIVLVH